MAKKRADPEDERPKGGRLKHGSGVRPQHADGAPRRGSGVLEAASKRQRDRRHSRYDAVLPVRFAEQGAERGAEPYSGHSDNLSLGGMFIETDAHLAHGAALRIWLTLPDGTELMFTGVVRWSTPRGMGIQHELLGARDTYVLSEYLASLQ